jgi:hypothetical protein
MKTIAAAALAATLGLAAIAASTNTASADWYGGNAVGGFALGTAVGLGIGAMAAQPRYYEVAPPRYVRRTSWNAHVEYCQDRYRSYDVRSDTYVGRNGQIRRCYGSY